MASIKLCKDKLHQMLNQYNKAVAAGKYHKSIPYKIWREMFYADEVEFSIGEHKIYVKVDNIEASIDRGENDFYDYLVQNYFNDISKAETFTEAISYSVPTGLIPVSDTFYRGITGTSSASIYVDRIDDLSNRVTNLEKTKNDKENETMKGFKFDFGPCTNDNIRMSMYGLAVKNNADTWVSYNPKSGEIVDVDILNFDGRKFMFKMPVAVKDIGVGDIVIHNRVPMFVTEIVDKTIKAVDVRAGERKEIIPTTNMFGFNFVTKVVSFFNAMDNAPTPDMPFGNMLPFLMLGDENGKDMDMDTMLMFMMMQNQGNANLMQNPMMMYFMMKDGDMKSDMLPLMMMMGMNQTPSQIQHPVPCAE